MSAHESFDRSHDAADGSDRAFGLVFAAVFGLVAAYRLWRGHADGPWWFVPAAGFLLLAQVRAAWLAPLNTAWMRLGRLLHAVVSPLLMGAMFWLLIVPIGWVLRLAGKDLLRLRRDPAAASYWVACPPPAARSQPMKDQF